MRDEYLGRILNEQVGYDAKDCMLYLIRKKRLVDDERKRNNTGNEPRDAAERERRATLQHKQNLRWMA